MEVPCGKCDGCLQDRATEWALRCEHEARLHLHNWFITLTYDQAHLPAGGSLQVKDLQDFWKRVRKEYSGVRYFACGEYGENYSRPHYHVLAFNFLPRDLTYRRELHGEKMLYDSAHLRQLWGHGSVWVDLFTPATAQYVTNYVRKKSAAAPTSPSQAPLVCVRGQGDPRASSVRHPEFQVMSRRPGIGSGFVSRFLSDIYPDGFVTRKGGSRTRAPRFYDLTLERVNARMYRKVKRARKAAAANNPEATGKRLLAREAYTQGRNAFFDAAKGRRYEKGEI